MKFLLSFCKNWEHTVTSSEKLYSLEISKLRNISNNKASYKHYKRSGHYEFSSSQIINEASSRTD